MLGALQPNGIRVGKARVQRTMKLHGIRAKGKKKFVVTTDSKHALPIATNLLNREFTVAPPNTVWTSDLFCPATYIPTDEGWLYLVAVIDLFSRKVVGWSMLRPKRTHMQASMVTDALRIAWFSCKPQKGLAFHSDQGSQYCSREFQGVVDGLRHAVINELQGLLLGQRAHREFVGPLESGAYTRPEVRHAARGDGRGDGLVDVLQPPQTSLHLGLRQPIAV